MLNLEEIVRTAIDRFARENQIERMAALIGGQAVIMHGVPRTTLDTDAILHFRQDKFQHNEVIEKFTDYLEHHLSSQYEIRFVKASSDPSDPLKHSLIRVADRENRTLRLDLLFANYQWEVDGLASMSSSFSGPLMAFPKPFLIGMKLMAGGSLDHDDIRNLLLLMSEDEINKAFEIASGIRKDRILKKLHDEVL